MGADGVWSGSPPPTRSSRRRTATQWRWGRKRFTAGVPVDHSHITSSAHNSKAMRDILIEWVSRGYIEVLPGKRTTYLLKTEIPEEP